MAAMTWRENALYALKFLMGNYSLRYTEQWTIQFLLGGSYFLLQNSDGTKIKRTTSWQFWRDRGSTKKLCRWWCWLFPSRWSKLCFRQCESWPKFGWTYVRDVQLRFPISALWLTHHVVQVSNLYRSWRLNYPVTQKSFQCTIMNYVQSTIR